MSNNNRQGGALIEITPEMIEAGVERLSEIRDASSAYLVSEVYLAMNKGVTWVKQNDFTDNDNPLNPILRS